MRRFTRRECENGYHKRKRGTELTLIFNVHLSLAFCEKISIL